MAAPVVDFTAFSTTDAAPTVAPHKVSRIEGKDDITYTWEAINGTILYWQESIGGSTRATRSRRLAHLGVVCGLGNRCGMAGSRPLAAATPVTESNTRDSDDFLPGEADGSHEFYVDALNADGWSS